MTTEFTASRSQYGNYTVAIIEGSSIYEVELTSSEFQKLLDCLQGIPEEAA